MLPPEKITPNEILTIICSINTKFGKSLTSDKNIDLEIADAIISLKLLYAMLQSSKIFFMQNFGQPNTKVNIILIHGELIVPQMKLYSLPPLSTIMVNRNV